MSDIKIYKTQVLVLQGGKQRGQALKREID